MSEEVKNGELQEEVEATDVVTEKKVERQPQGDAQSEELQKTLKCTEDLKNRYLRVYTKMQNIQRRTNEEYQQLRKYRSQDLAKTILPSLDNLERALTVEGLTDDVKKGLEMTHDSSIRALSEEGVEEVIVENSNHSLHTAVQTLSAGEEHPTNSITQVLQKDYKFHERLLRPAMAVVYSQPLAET